MVRIRTAHSVVFFCETRIPNPEPRFLGEFVLESVSNWRNTVGQGTSNGYIADFGTVGDCSPHWS